MKKYDWSDIKNILCIRPDNMGDVLMTQPAMRALKNSHPDRNITLLTSTMGAKMGHKLPAIDEVIVFDVPWVKTDAIGNNKAIQNLVSRLKVNNFDAAAIFTNYSQSAQPSAMICYLAGIPSVLAYSRVNPYKLINHWVPDKEPFSFPKHGVQRQLDLVKAAGANISDKEMRLSVEKKTNATALQKLEEAGVETKKPWLILHPGVSEGKREYPVWLYGKTADLLAKEGCQVIITGLKCEDDLTCGVEKASTTKIFNVAGRLSLDEFIAIINSTPIIVSNNTAPVHIAAAVNTPVVDLYARTNPEHTPWMVHHRTLYFDVPKSNRSQNTTLSHTTPDDLAPVPQPKDIVTAVHELFNNIPAQKSNLSSSITNWSNEKRNNPNPDLQPEPRLGRNTYKPLLSKLPGF